MTRFKRILKTAAKILIALVLVLFAAYGLLNYYWGRQIEARLTAIKAAGQPVSLADLQGQPVPEQDNAAPIYKRAFKAMSEPATERDIEALSRVNYSPSQTPSQADWASAKSALERCDSILALIEKAHSKPACQFPAHPVVDGTSRESVQRYEALSRDYFEQMAGLRNAARLLSAKMVLSAREGNTQDLVKYARSALKLNDAIKQNAMLIEYLVDVAIIRIALANVRQALGYCQPSESELRQLDSALSSIDAPKLYTHAVEGECVHFLRQNYEFRKGRIGVPFSSGDTLAYLDFISKHLECTRMSYSAALSKGLVGPNAASNLPFYAVFTKITAPVTVKAAGARYRCEAEIACGRSFLALRAHRARFGEYPQTLSELRSKMEWDLPKDPFTGKDLVYKRAGKGFILYSLGEDLADGGGTAKRSRSEAESPGDIVWKTDR